MKTREAPTEEVLLALGYRSVSYAVTNIFTALRGLTCRDGATRYLHGIGTRRDCFQVSYRSSYPRTHIPFQTVRRIASCLWCRSVRTLPTHPECGLWY